LDSPAAGEIARLFGDWAREPGALYRQLATALAEAIERGDLLPGALLPPERDLARAVAVGRSTVVAAYGDLRQRGLVERRQGAGTWVRHLPAGSGGERPGELGLSLQHKLASLGAAVQPDTISLLGATPAAPRELPELAAEAAGELGALQADHGYFPLGYPPLRQAIAARLSDLGLPTDEDDVLVTSGAQQAIKLTALGFVGRGDFVVVEDPTFHGALDAYRRVGARLLPVVVGEGGIDLESLEQTLARATVRLVYVMPAFQNPTGVAMAPGALAALSQLVRRAGALLVQDATLAELSLVEAEPPLRATRGDDTLVIGSLSKTFWGGVRIGWIRGPRALIGHLGRVKAVVDLGSSLPSQILALHVLRRIDKLVAARNAELRERLALLRQLVSTSLDGWSWQEPAGGLVLWARLPRGSATELAAVCRRHRVEILPGSLASPSGRFDEHVRLPFVAPPQTLAEGVQRLAHAWREYNAAAASSRPRPSVVV
jgi:DNA-binding transcriptional MocR family regulator